jgi:site-specific DNA recombinase
MSQPSVPHASVPRQSPALHSTHAAGRLAAIYARVSTEDQGKGYSIPTQIEACQRLAQQEGYLTPDSHIFVDEGITGTTLDRPALRRVRDLVTSQAIAALIILDPDRLSRKMGKLLVLTDELQAANIRLLCVSHPVEHGPEGTLFFQMRGVIAEYEREKILERMHRGRIGRVKSGYHHGGGIPLGYRYIPEPHKGQFEIDEEEAAVVRRIFTMYLDGMNIRGIAFQLSRERILTKVDRHKTNGRKQYGAGIWGPASVHGILRNETYIGTMYWNKRQAVSPTRMQKRDRAEWQAIPIPALISQEVFDAVQQKLAHNKAMSRRNRKHEYLFLGGRLRCGRCGASMRGYSPHNTPRYRCASAFQHHPGEPFCRGGVRADVIEPRIWQEIERILGDPTKIIAELDRKARQEAQGQQDMTKERRAIQKALAALEREAQRWDEAYAHEVIELTELKAKKLDITERQRRLLAQQEAVDAAMHVAHEATARTRDILTYCLRIKEQLTPLDVPRKRQALEALNVHVTWAPGEPIRFEGDIPMGNIVHNAL